MKIRKGFVSNSSSSSSFVIVGSELRYAEAFTLAKKLIPQKRLYASSGEYGEDGANLFCVTKKMFDLYHKHGGNLNFYDIQHKICEGGTLKKKDIVDEEFFIFTMEVSDHSINSLEEFKQLLGIPERKPRKPKIPKRVIKNRKK